MSGESGARPGTSLLTTLIAAASAIAAVTPTPRDDNLVGKLYRLVDFLALNVGRAKDVAPNRDGGRFVPG